MANAVLMYKLECVKQSIEDRLELLLLDLLERTFEVPVGEVLHDEMALFEFAVEEESLVGDHGVVLELLDVYEICFEELEVLILHF
jgi:hypothetical protein